MLTFVGESETRSESGEAAVADSTQAIELHPTKPFYSSAEADFPDYEGCRKPGI